MKLFDLYRPEAVKHFRERLYGEVRLGMAETHWAITALIALLLLGLLATLFGVHYTRRQTVAGWLQPDLGRLELRADEAAVVDAVMVREGDAVRAGQPLLLLRTAKSSRDGSPAHTALQAALQKEAQQLHLQQVQARAQEALQQKRLMQDAALLQQEIAHLHLQLQTQQKRVDIAQQQQQQSLALVRQGFSPQQEAQKMEALWLEQSQAWNELQQRLLSKQQDLTLREHELKRLPMEQASQQAALEERLANVQQRLAEADQHQQWAITAPMEGQVLRLAIKRGQSCLESGLLAELMPQGARLEAELFAGSAAITGLQPGAPVRLRLDAYPHEKFGSLQGRLLQIEPSSSPLSPETLAQLPAGVPHGPVYKLRVSLAPQPLPLRSGMSLQADVSLERRRLIEFLLTPLLALAPGDGGVLNGKPGND